MADGLNADMANADPSGLNTTVKDVAGACAAQLEADSCEDPAKAKAIVIGAIFVILVCSLTGYFLTAFGGRWSKRLKAGSTPFHLAKSFSAGIVLSLGFVHVLTDGVEQLGSECLEENPWHKYPMGPFLCLMGVLLTLFFELLTTQMHRWFAGETGTGHTHSHSREVKQPEQVPPASEKDVESGVKGQGVLTAKRVVADVLEIGIITHSVLIGVGLGATTSKCTARNLLIALAFHQLFEGIALASAIVEAELSFARQTIMGLAFAITTPVGTAIGLGIRSSYNKDATHNLITQGVFNCVTAGVLIYLALVDLIAMDFFNSRVATASKLRWSCYVSLVLGCGAMALLAYWA